VLSVDAREPETYREEHRSGRLEAPPTIGLNVLARGAHERSHERKG
jgi:hypothetical protein